MFFGDYTYILVIIGAVISAMASLNVTRTYQKFNRAGNSRGLTAECVAGMILNQAGIYDVRIERIRGSLTDHYSPREKVLKLSDSVYGSTSIAAIGVAAHECGHAIQHRAGYLLLKLRSLSVPIANIGSWLSWPIILIGLLLGSPELAQAGVILFTFVVAFQLITLPVEFNASRRACSVLDSHIMLTREELDGASSVLKAAAMTYVASLFATVLQLLRLVLITRGSRRR